MLIESLEFKGYKCFRESWAGFERLQQVNLIIGRNNTGKSHLLALAQLGCQQDLKSHPFGRLRVSGHLTEEDLRRGFQETTSAGELGGNHWHDHGIRLVGARASFELAANKIDVELEESALQAGFNPRSRPQESTDRITGARRRQVELSIRNSLRSPYSGFAFRHILADRDIRPEAAEISGESLAPDGSGATNLVRRFLNSSDRKFNRELIRGAMLDGLNEIFGGDGEFLDIVTRHHEQQTGQPWEIYLEQRHKGLVALSDSGSGLKTVLLVLLNLLAVPALTPGKPPVSSYVFAFEELENNLHPALLRRLLRFVREHIRRTGAVLFLTTHSNVVLDFFAGESDSQIIQVTHDGESAHTRGIQAHFDGLSVIADLGARPSDLLQANGIVWVEGPSDRIYLNRWIELVAGTDLREGRDYQCAFYGGGLLGRVQVTSPEDAEKDLVNLIAVNPNIALMADKDLPDNRELKPRLKRIKEEAKRVGALVWITKGLEIENYLPAEALGEVLGLQLSKDPEGEVRFFPPSTKARARPTTRGRAKPAVTSYLGAVAGKTATTDKVKLALEVTPHLTLANMAPRLDWESQMDRLIERIRSWRRE